MIFVENYPLAAAVREVELIKDYVGFSPTRSKETGLWKIKLINRDDIKELPKRVYD